MIPIPCIRIFIYVLCLFWFWYTIFCPSPIRHEQSLCTTSWHFESISWNRQKQIKPQNINIGCIYVTPPKAPCWSILCVFIPRQYGVDLRPPRRNSRPYSGNCVSSETLETAKGKYKLQLCYIFMLIFSRLFLTTVTTAYPTVLHVSRPWNNATTVSYTHLTLPTIYSV